MLDGLTSYHAWSQNMTVFLKCRRLWRYVSGSIPKPVPNPKSKATSAEESSKTAVTTNDHYNCTTDSSLVFHIESTLYQMCQETSQSISDFYS